jgi:hypothetical protein
MTGDTRSLWLVFTPMLKSPAFTPCVSVWGIGTNSDVIPSTIISNPAKSNIFIKRPHLGAYVRLRVTAFATFNKLVKALTAALGQRQSAQQ